MLLRANVSLERSQMGYGGLLVFSWRVVQELQLSLQNGVTIDMKLLQSDEEHALENRRVSRMNDCPQWGKGLRFGHFALCMEYLLSSFV